MKNLRKQFPAHKTQTYLNTAGVGLLSETVFDFKADKNLDLLTLGSEFMQKHETIYAEVREAVAEFLNGKAQYVALVPNFSIGFNTLLEATPQNTNFLLLKEDYPSVNMPVEARNFTIDYVHIQENLEEAIYKAFKIKQPKVFAFSIVQYLNGIKLSQEFIKELKKDFPDTILVADGTQYCGTEIFDFENSGIDVLGVSAYKWLNAGLGAGFFMLKPEVENFFKPKMLGYGSNLGKYKEQPDCFIGKFEAGHLDATNIGSLLPAINLIKQTGQENIQRYLEELSGKVKTALSNLNLLEKSVVNRKQHSTIFNLKGDDALFKKLMAKNIICSQRGEGIRVSFHHYNTVDDLNKLLEIIT